MSSRPRPSRAELALAWAPAAAYMALIFTLSSIRIELPSLPTMPMRDKLIHLVEYGALGFFLAHATLRTWPDRPRARMVALSAFLGSAFGLSDELHQAFVPGRTAEFLDFVADTIGASCGAYARGLLSRFASARRSALRPASVAIDSSPKHDSPRAAPTQMRPPPPRDSQESA